MSSDTITEVLAGSRSNPLAIYDALRIGDYLAKAKASMEENDVFFYNLTYTLDGVAMDEPAVGRIALEHSVSIAPLVELSRYVSTYFGDRENTELYRNEMDPLFLELFVQPVKAVRGKAHPAHNDLLTAYLRYISTIDVDHIGDIEERWLWSDIIGSTLPMRQQVAFVFYSKRFSTLFDYHDDFDAFAKRTFSSHREDWYHPFLDHQFSTIARCISREETVDEAIAGALEDEEVLSRLFDVRELKPLVEARLAGTQSERTKS